MLWIGGHLFGFLFQFLNQAFITWLAMRDALTTGRNLFICGFQGDVKCIFCRHVIEDRDHLFFACGYSSKIWQQVMSLCSMLNRPTCREDVAFFGFEEWRGKTMKTYLCRLVFAFTIYNIWRNHNALRHNNNPCSKEKLIQHIRWEVRIQFATKGRFKKTRENDIICSA
jgi:hypothetical protein